MIKQINKVHTLDLFIELTQELDSKYKDEQIPFNMSSILSLKKIRSFQIEYFINCDGRGAAFKILERMLANPPSKTWGLLGSDVIGLIQYWLDAVRKHLINHHLHWWRFLKEILVFIKEIRMKNQALSTLLVEEIAEPMLDLATSGKPDLSQRYEILHTFNLFCADSLKDVRINLKENFEPYFCRLSTIMASCGYLPVQFAVVETLLRWLAARHEPAVRARAATRWFLPPLYQSTAVDIFLNRNWTNFIKDCRDFLNCHNESKDLVTSVICSHLSIEDLILISGEEKHESWMDVNRGNSSITVALQPQVLEALGSAQYAWLEMLTIQKDIVTTVTLQRESSQLTLSLELSAPPVLAPPSPCQRALGARRALRLVLAPTADLPRLHRALTHVFRDHYQAMVDVNSSTVSSPLQVGSVQRKNSRDEITSPVKENQQKLKKGITRWSKRSFDRSYSSKSPSTNSTTSLVQFHDRLVNFPSFEFPERPKIACREPNLSVVSEADELVANSLERDSELKPNRCTDINENKKSQSDSEIIKKHTHEEINETTKSTQSEKYVRKTIPHLSLCAVSLRSADNSIINEIIERAPDDIDINTESLSELLVKEALQYKRYEDKDRLSDSGINVEDGKKTQEQDKLDSDAIEDTQNTEKISTKGSKNVRLRNIKAKTATSKVISKSTSDESNTEAILEAPVSYVNLRKRNQRRKSVKKNVPEIVDDNSLFDDKVVDELFSQHFTENQRGENILSPTLVKKIIVTSSESSEMLLKDTGGEFDNRNKNTPDLDVVECLNDIVDKVCSDFEKCTEYLKNKGPETEILKIAKDLKIILHKVEVPKKTDKTTVERNLVPQKSTKAKGKQTNPINLKYISKKQKSILMSKSKLTLEPVDQMATIIEANVESDAYKTSCSGMKKISTESKTPITRKKRKLYSPKDDQITFDESYNEIHGSQIKVHNDDSTLATPKSTASCYKDIEKEHKKCKRFLTRKAKNVKSQPLPVTTTDEEVFEHLKDNIENDEIILADKKFNKDAAIFNFTSDSEDEDFKQKKLELRKRTSTTTLESGTSVLSTRRGRIITKANYKDDDKESTNGTATKPKRKRAVRRNASKKARSQKEKVDHHINLRDETIREALSEQLNTSFVVTNVNNVGNDDVPMIQAPVLEGISDENADTVVGDCKVNKREKVVKKQVEEKTAKSKKGVNKQQKSAQKSGKAHHEDKDNLKNATKDDEGTISPLPGLVIETEMGKNEVEDSLTTNMTRKFAKIYKDGPEAYNDPNTTQNMLSDNEKGISSPNFNITDELSKVFADDNNDKKETSKGNEKVDDEIGDIIDNTINSDHMSRISLAETSKSKRHLLRLKTKNKTDLSVNGNSVKEEPTKTIITTKKEDQIVIRDSQTSKKSIKSHIDQIDYDEIICIESEFVTESEELKSRSVSKNNKIIAIDGESIIDSERSIATEGITAHGDTNEMAPSPTQLAERLTPREISDMDENIKTYFIELSKKVNNRTDSTESQANNKKDAEKIEKFFEKSKNTHVNKYQKDLNYAVETMLPSRRQSESEWLSETSSKRTPSVLITRLSSKDLAKWLPLEKITPETSFSSTQKTGKTVIRQPDNSENSANTTSEDRPKLKTKRKSQISPVNLDFMQKQQEHTSRYKDDTVESQDKDIVDKLDCIAKKYFVKPTYESSPISKGEGEETEELTPKRAPKRSGPVCNEVGLKKRKFEERVVETIDLSHSRQSSNIENWLKHMVVSSGADSTEHILQTVCEKIETTLEEIHQNTTKDFINLFVENHEILLKMKEERRITWREQARTMLSTVVREIDQQFALMEQRAEERENEFMEHLKTRAAQVLRRDVHMKQALVAILRDDVQAVAEHIARTQH